MSQLTDKVFLVSLVICRYVVFRASLQAIQVHYFTVESDTLCYGENLYCGLRKIFGWREELLMSKSKKRFPSEIRVYLQKYENY